MNQLWQEYSAHKPDSKTWRVDGGRFRNYIQTTLGNKEPKDLVQLDIDRLRLSLAKNKKPQTVKHILVLLQRIINFGIKKGLCPGSGFKIEMPRINNIKTEDLSLDQLSQLMEAIVQEPIFQRPISCGWPFLPECVEENSSN